MIKANTCTTCACNKVCDHNKYGFEVCGNYIGGWISVKDRLPEEDCNVLVIANGRYKNIEFKNAYELGCYCSSEGWILESHIEWGNPDIAYWRPLPELP